MRTILTAILMAFMLSGCMFHWNTPHEPIERTVYKFIQVPKEMTEKVVAKAPPEPVEYSTQSPDQQESILVKLIQDHNQSIGTCNARLYGIHEWSNRQLKIYEPIN